MTKRNGPRSGLLPVAGGFSQMIRSGSVRDAKTGTRAKARQFRLKIAIDESFGPPQARRALAVARLADIVAMRDALVAVERGAQAEFLMRKAGAVAGDEEKFSFALAAAKVVMSRPNGKRANEAAARFVTWGQLARAWGSQELARLYPNAGYGKRTAEATDAPRIEYLCKFIENVPLESFNDDDYWRAMRPARERCKTDSTFKAYAQVCRRVLKIGVELRIIPAWPLSAVCKLPIVAKGEAPEFPFLYPEEYARLVRCAEVPIEFRVLWGFIIREGLRLGEAFRIRWEHLAQLPEQHGMRSRWVLNVPDTKTGRALMFVLNAGSGEVLEAFRRLRPELAGPFVWLKATNLKKAAEQLRKHVELSGTNRERLLFTAGRLRRLREHDLRSTYVSSSKLAGVDNETIAQHTGHESNTMIARYNRSKATIEHLGLAPYLPLDQAMGLDVAGALARPELAAGDVPELGDGETNPASRETTGGARETTPRDVRPGPGLESMPPADLGGVRCVTSPLRLPSGPTNAELTPPADLARELAAATGLPVWCWTGGALDTEGYVAECDECHERKPVEEVTIGGASACVCAECRCAPSNAVEKSDIPASLPSVAYAGDGSADLGHRDPKPLNTAATRDPGCDHGHAEAEALVPQNGETSMFYASCAREGSNLHALRRWNLNPAPGDRNEQTTGEPGGLAAPETTGSDPGSHPAVTLLGQLEASARTALAEHNWAALRALEPVIEAEVARLAEAARGAPPAPVRLDLVRAERGRK